MLGGLQNEHVLVARVEPQVRRRILDFALSVFSNVTPLEVVPPGRDVSVAKFEASARVALIAANDSSWEEAAFCMQVPNSHITDVNRWLQVARVKRIVEAAGSITIWFFLLLLTDIYGPPEREVNVDVVVRDVNDLGTDIVTTRLSALSLIGTRVSLHINALNRVIKVNIREGDAANAVVVLTRWNRTSRCANTEEDAHVPHSHILATVVFSHPADLFVARLDGDCVIEVADLHVLDKDIGSPGVDTISIQREGRQREHRAWTDDAHKREFVAKHSLSQ
jgi:hypothetical protein